MEDVERLLKGTVEELDRLLDAKNVLGAPFEKNGATIIPMVSYGFGFGAGADEKQGRGGGTGGGGGIKPVGAITHRHLDRGRRRRALSPFPSQKGNFLSGHGASRRPSSLHRGEDDRTRRRRFADLPRRRRTAFSRTAFVFCLTSFRSVTRDLNE